MTVILLGCAKIRTRLFAINIYLDFDKIDKANYILKISQTSKLLTDLIWFLKLIHVYVVKRVLVLSLKAS